MANTTNPCSAPSWMFKLMKSQTAILQISTEFLWSQKWEVQIEISQFQNTRRVCRFVFHISSRLITSNTRPVPALPGYHGVNCPPYMRDLISTSFGGLSSKCQNHAYTLTWMIHLPRQVRPSEARDTQTVRRDRENRDSKHSASQVGDLGTGQSQTGIKRF